MASETRFADLRRRLEEHGWKIRVKGSHHIFSGPGRPTLSIPVHKGRVKAFYVRQAEAAIRAFQEREESEKGAD